MQLLGNRVLVQPLPSQHEASPILRTHRYEPDPMMYLILDCGPGPRLPDGRHLPMELFPGLKCLLNPATANRHPLGDGRYIVEAADIQSVWV